MNQITEISSNEQQMIIQLRTLSPENQQVVIDLIGALQAIATKSQEPNPELEDNVKISVHQVLGKSDLTFEHEGQVIYTLITKAFNQGKRVVLSFHNVQRITWLFITKAIGQLYEHFSESQIQSCLHLVDLTEEDVEFINHVIETKKEFLINPEKFRQPMSDERLEELRQKNPENSILKVLGMFKDDETFDDMLANIAEYRRELDEEHFRQLDAESAEN